METVINAVILYIVAFVASAAILPKNPENQTFIHMILVVAFGTGVTLATLSYDYSLTNIILSMATLTLMHVLAMSIKPRMLR